MQAGERLARHSPYSTVDPDLKTNKFRPSGPLGGDGVNVLGMRKG